MSSVSSPVRSGTDIPRLSRVPCAPSELDPTLVWLPRILPQANVMVPNSRAQWNRHTLVSLLCIVYYNALYATLNCKIHCAVESTWFCWNPTLPSAKHCICRIIWICSYNAIFLLCWALWNMHNWKSVKYINSFCQYKLHSLHCNLHILTNMSGISKK